MKNKIIKRAVVFLLSLICIFAVAAATSVAASANADETVVSMIAFPRGGGTDTWGRPNLTLMNGWTVYAHNLFHALGASNRGMQVVYCVQPGVPLRTGDRNPHITPEELFASFDNGVLTSAQVQLLLGRLFQHGFNGTVSTELSYAQITEIIATQALVWEIIVGERNPDFSHRAPPAGINRSLEMVRPNHPHRALIMQHYDRIVAAVQNHSTIPSFLRGSLASAVTHELTWNGTAFSTTLNDTNGVLANFNFTSTTPGVSFNRVGNNLTISTNTAPTGVVDITATRTGSRAGLVFWSNNPIHIISNIQSIVTITTAVPDNITAFARVNASTGSLRIEKTMQGGGSAAGFEFEVRNAAGDLIGTFTSGTNGQVTIPNLPAGQYTVREINIPAGYEVVGENPLTITVSPNQTAVARFTNRRMDGQIRIEKYNANPAMGTPSLAGAVFEIRRADGTVVETITTNAQGIATSGTLPWGDYVVVEITAPAGFVLDSTPRTVTLNAANLTVQLRVPNTPQTGRISVQKQGNVLVGAQQIETIFGTQYLPIFEPRGLPGAVFEIRDSQGILVDTITTATDGIATSRELPLGEYTLVEVTAPHGFVLDPTPHVVVLSYADQYTAVVTETLQLVNIRQRVTIELQKYMELHDDEPMPFQYVIFGIFANEDIFCADGEIIITAGSLIGTISLDEYGRSTFEAELPWASFVIRELQTAEGYLLSDEEFAFTVEPGEQDVAVIVVEVNDGEAIVNYLEPQPEPEPEPEPGPEPQPEPEPKEPTPERPNVPQTGDDTQQPWAMLVLATAGLLGLIAMKVVQHAKKKKQVV